MTHMNNNSHIRFNFSTSARILFGWDSLKELPAIASGYGKHVLFLHSRSVREIDRIRAALVSEGCDVIEQVFSGEPTDSVLQVLLDRYRSKKIDVVIGVGGGSVLDAGKALSALLANPGDLMDYLEVVGKGMKLTQLPLPFIAIPSTAGTGTEVTKNAVIKVESQHVKVSMRDVTMIPRVALVDPALTCSVPPAVTASTGMDAFIQVIEPYCSSGANSMVDLFCREGIPMAAHALPLAYHAPHDRSAREQMAFVSLLGGLSLANAKLGAVHGFAGPVGGMFDVPHGVICACLLPQVFRMNASKVRATGDATLISRFEDIAAWVLPDGRRNIEDAVDWFRALNESLSIPRLNALGIRKTDHSLIIEKSLVSSSMKGNPVPLVGQDLRTILENS